MVYDITLCYNAPATTIGNHTFIFKGASISNNWAKINIDGTVQQISYNTWYNVDSTLKIKVINLDSGGCANYGYSGIIISVDGPPTENYCCSNNVCTPNCGTLPSGCGGQCTSANNWGCNSSGQCVQGIGGTLPAGCYGQCTSANNWGCNSSGQCVQGIGGTLPAGCYGQCVSVTNGTCKDPIGLGCISGIPNTYLLGVVLLFYFMKKK